MEGFSYNGIHCEELGLTYIPAAEDRMLSVPDYKPTTKTVTAHPGAYWYENTVSQRDFVLNCLFEDVTEEVLERILQWVDRESYGKLIFDERPYIYYLVRPSKPPSGKRYVTHSDCFGNDVSSGTIQLTFTAYDPFGYLNTLTSDGYEDAKIRCGIIPSAMMPLQDTTLNKVQLVYNPGTEKCPVRIKIAGTAANGLTIRNYTTGEVCSLVRLPESDSLVVDSSLGMVSTFSDHKTAFAYHNDGYITLASCVPYARDVDVSWTNGSNTITSQGKFLKMYENNYVYIGDKWMKILKVYGANSAVVDSNVTAETGSAQTVITRMNEIYITGEGAELTLLQFDYTPMTR